MVITGMIAGLIALALLLVVVRLAPQLQSRQVVFGREPDTPKAFGYKMSWLAVRTKDTDALVGMLGLVTPEPCNWNSGIGAVYDRKLGDYHVFVSPPIDGWSFVVGLSIPHPTRASLVDKLTPLLVNLGNRFGDVQYFFNYPLIDFFAWARGSKGRVVRAFAICDEGVVWNKGQITRVEKHLGLKLFELRGVRSRRGDAGGELIFYPTEDQVLRLAGDWGLDPSRIEEKETTPALGVIGLAPSAWRAELAKEGQASLQSAKTGHLSAA